MSEHPLGHVAAILRLCTADYSNETTDAVVGHALRLKQIIAELEAENARLREVVLSYAEFVANPRDNGVGEIEARARMIALAKGGAAAR